MGELSLGQLPQIELTGFSSWHLGQLGLCKGIFDVLGSGIADCELVNPQVGLEELVTVMVIK